MLAKISTILLNIQPTNAGGLNLTSTAKVPGSAWGEDTSDESVIFFDSHLLCGVLDKSQFGASSYGLVHSIYELYGAECAGQLLGILSRLFTHYLQHRGFTCRMDDLRLTREADSQRAEALGTAAERGLTAAKSFVGLGESDDVAGSAMKLKSRLEETLRDDAKSALLDVAVKGQTSLITSNVIKSCLPSGLMRHFPSNHMQAMTISGAKGSQVNASQISCLLGQQDLEGRRVPVMVSGKTLPSFRQLDTAPRAGGFVTQRFFSGIRPQEYYFHCMAGREGLIDTAVKTSRSGYLQRCLIKHLEGIRVHYDHTVRNNDSSIVQFLYGEDGVDVTKSRHLNHFEFAIRNDHSLIQRYKPTDIVGRINDQSAPAHTSQLLTGSDRGSSLPPTLSLFSPSSFLGSVSESFARNMDSYLQRNPDRLLKAKKKQRKAWPPFVRTSTLMQTNHFTSLMHIRYLRALVDPGEAVGLLAAQGYVDFFICTSGKLIVSSESGSRLPR